MAIFCYKEGILTHPLFSCLYMRGIDLGCNETNINKLT